jgi:stage III sporulation protein SpoIIIAA
MTNHPVDTDTTRIPDSAPDYTDLTGRPVGGPVPANDNMSMRRPDGEQEITDDLEQLLLTLPPAILRELEVQGNRDDLLEVVLDLGRKPEARFRGGEALLGDVDVTREDLRYVVERIGHFGEDNRAGIERTLHRISCIRNRAGDIIGLTCRIGRAVFGTINIIRDLVESGKSILLLGPPGVGKTTLLREVARVESEEFRKRVVIVDTSNEIAGDGDIPHPAIGRARRMQVPSPASQHAVMIEAVENHMPEVIVIDEIGTELEAAAARTIAERGVQLVGTAHGTTLENLMLNPTLSDLIGGIQTVTLGDEEARRRGTQKSVLERKAPPTFDVMVEILDRDRVAVHEDVAEVVDSILRGAPVAPEIRERHTDGRIVSRPGQFEQSRDNSGYTPAPGRGSYDQQRTGRMGRSHEGGRNGGRSHAGGRDGGRDGGRGGYTPADRPGGRIGSAQVPTGMAASMASMSPGPTRQTAPSTRSAAPPAFDERLDRRAAAVGFTVYDDVDDEDMDEADLAPVTPVAAPAVPRPPRAPGVPGSSTKPLRIYPFGVSRTRLEQAIGSMNLDVSLSKDIGDADVVLTLKNYYRKKPPALRQAEAEGLPVYVLKSNTAGQMQSILGSLFEIPEGGLVLDESGDPVTAAMEETEAAITETLETGHPVELPPANAYIRRLQHQMAERYNLGSQSRGREPNRRVRIFRQE